MKKLIVGMGLALFATLAFALPTLQQVETATNQGRFVEAEGMMAEVVAAKPDSAKAHYIYAELLAHNAKFSQSAGEADRAKQLDPKIGFTDPAKFNAFEQKLQREQTAAPRPRTSVERPVSSVAPSMAAEPAGRSGIPGWIWLVGLAILAIVLWRGFSRSRAAGQGGALATAGGPAGYGPGGASPGYGPAGGNPGYGYGPGAVAPAARPGSGLLGTGLAVAGGVAGGMLIDEMLHRRGENGASNLGGFDQGGSSSSDQAASDLESRPIDFGSGNDWDSGGGSIDTGGDSSSLGGDWD